jgi:dipeptidase E
MRLFLSSQDLGTYPEVASKLAGSNKKAAFIKNAQDDKPAEERNFTTPEKKKMFEALGLQLEEIDLRDYFGRQKELAEKISGFGSIWSAGGNTFILRRAMQASGLDVILKELLEKNKILYGGWSAGACVAAPSLHGIEYGDRPQPEAVPDSYPSKEIIWEGLNLVPYMVVPHCKSDWWGKEADECIKYLESHNIQYKPLEDGQVMVVDGGKTKFLQ